MAQYGTIYRLQWNTVPQVLSASITVPAQVLIVNIYDTFDLIEDFQTPVVVSLLPSGTPLVIKVTNNDEDKFSPIRAKQAIIQFTSDALQFEDTATFADSEDNRWYVEITADGEFIFKGYVVLSELQQAHLPDPNLVQLIASDHLALLKDIPLTDDDGDNPTGKHRLAELIALCLKKTGLRLPIIAVNNLRHGGNSITEIAGAVQFNTSGGIALFSVDAAHINFFYPGQQITISGTISNDGTYYVLSTAVLLLGVVFITGTVTTEVESGPVTITDADNGHIYDKTYLDVLTFEKEVGACEDCYTVLKKILGEDCFLSQWKGSWYIMRIDEYDGNPIYEATFSINGDLQSIDTVGKSYAKSIGASETRKLAIADALRRYDQKYGSVREVFDFTFPSEIPCNVDYIRGDETTDTDVQRSGYTSYELECWDPRRKWGTNLVVPSFKAAILRSFTAFGDEDQRFIMLTKPASATGAFEYIRSEAIPVSFYDKFIWRFDARALTSTSGDGSILVCIILLYGTDGNVYILRNSDITTNWNQDSTDVNTTWKLTNSDVSLFQDGMQWGIFDDSDHAAKTSWVSFEMPAAPVPVEGNVYIHLFAANQQSGTYDDFDICYQNLAFDYYPYIGGVYKKYNKFHNKVTRDPVGYFSSMREKTVFMEDSPKPIFKGAMFVRTAPISIYSGSVTFAAPNVFTISGYHIGDVMAGAQIKITGTNAGDYVVTDVIYHIIGNVTEIQVSGSITTITESSTISVYTFGLTRIWYSSAPFALGPPPDTTYLHSYGYIQSFSVWNQYRNGNRILSSSVLGLGSMWPDIFDKWSITDTNPHVNNRYFMLISFEQNWKTALWSGVFIEDYRTDIGKVYTDNQEFKYLTK